MNLFSRIIQTICMEEYLASTCIFDIHVLNQETVFNKTFMILVSFAYGIIQS